MECYYLDARTSDTICSYQIQTQQIETHNTQDRSLRVATGLGVLVNKERIGKTNVTSSISKQSNEIKT